MKFKEIMKKYNTIKGFDELTYLNYFGTMLATQEEVIEEMNDEELQHKFSELNNLVFKKRQNIFNSEITMDAKDEL